VLRLEGTNRLERVEVWSTSTALARGGRGGAMKIAIVFDDATGSEAG
jgi:hypothetical protein